MGGAPAIPIYLHERLGKKMDGRVKPGQDEWAVAARRANQRFGCPVPLAKIFRFTRRANHLYKFAPSHPTRGAYHDRHGRGVRMRWTRQRFARNGIAGRVMSL